MKISLIILTGLMLISCTGTSGDNEQVSDTETDSLGFYSTSVDESFGASVVILLDNSGSMEDVAEGDSVPKYKIARRALVEMLNATEKSLAARENFPVKIGIYSFSSDVEPVFPLQLYNRDSIHSALQSLPLPDGGTAIGDAMSEGRRALYKGGTFRKYLLVLTDGENTSGRDPKEVAKTIHEKSEGAVEMYFVAFDISKDNFDFVRDVKGEVLGAANGAELEKALESIYQGKILAESGSSIEPIPAQSGITREPSLTNRRQE